jgi:cell division protein FtsB
MENTTNPVFSKRFQTISRWIVLLVLWLIIGSIAIGKAGIANFMQLLHERDVLVQSNRELEIQNQYLEQKMNDLKSSRLRQVHYLKQNFGYVEQNEYVFQFKNSLDDGNLRN